MAAALHISISAEKVLSLGGLNVSNSMLTSLIVSGLLIAFAFMVRASLKDTDRPTGLQNFVEWMVESLHNMVLGVTGSIEKTRLFFPLFATFFLFILLNNWLGLVPGVGTIGFTEESTTEHAQLLPSNVEVGTPQAYAATPEAAPHDADVINEEPTAETISTHEAEAQISEHKVFVPYLRAGTADLNTTLALGIISVFITQIFGFQFQRFSYFKKFFNFSSPIAFFIGILETILELAKVVSFAFRLFGNIFAGEVLLAVISFLVPVIVPMPFYGVEVAVGVIQALVFSMLSLVFFNMATISHDEH
jgi:F-type H+-transporting ATPase subunit a